MSQENKEHFKCAECGHGQDFTCYSSLNVSLNPELKAKLFSKELTTFKCEQCGDETQVAFNMLYHDMEKSLMIQLDYYPDEEDSEQCDKAITEETKGYTFRKVHSINELIEKISIFGAGQNDKVIELIKSALYSVQSDSTDLNFYFVKVDDESSGIAKILFAKVADGTVEEVAVDLSKTVGKVEQILEAQGLSKELNEGEWLKVDKGYAMKIIQSASDQPGLS